MYSKMTVLTLLPCIVIGCSGYFPGRQSYWDARVKELCEKDAGVTVHERVALSPPEYKLLRGVGGHIALPSRQSAGADAPYYLEAQEEVIRSGEPTVTRRETRIIRKVDVKVLSRWITYGRTGGDVPSLSHHSFLVVVISVSRVILSGKRL
jgi:hypothetical protein